MFNIPTRLFNGMNYRMFLGIIEREYTNKVASIMLRIEAPGIFGKNKGEAELRKSIDAFKNWFIGMLRTETLSGPDNVELRTVDYICHTALTKEAIPPFRPLHPLLVKALSLFTLQELEALFGSAFAANFSNMVGKGTLK